jgi:hypothetical protein
VNISSILSSANGPGHDITNVTVRDNVLEANWQAGIWVQPFDPALMRSVHLVGNHVKTAGTSAVSGYGIYLSGTQTLSSTQPQRIDDVVVEGNTLDGTFTASAVALSFFPRVTLRGNSVDGSYIAIYGPDSAVVENNVVRNSAGAGLYVAFAPNRPHLRGNTVWNWGRTTGGSAVILDNVGPAEVRGNVFRYDGASAPTAVAVPPWSHDVVVFGNQLIGTWPNGLPYANDGSNSNLGTFQPAAGAASMTVTQSLAKPASTVAVYQIAGAPLAATVVAGSGSFTVTFAAPPTGSEKYRFEVDP